MSTRILRRVCRTGPLRRNVSSSAPSSSSSAPPSKPSSSSPKSYPSYTTLPPTKLRALISLYHQSENFITAENLDKAIDHAFSDITSTSLKMSHERPHRDLANEVDARRQQPKLGTAQRAVLDRDRNYATGGTWSDNKSKRAHKVWDALYGVEGKGKPGLEALLDEEPRIREHLKKDRDQ